MTAIKSVGYAYPSSDRARAMGCADDGCHYVVVWPGPSTAGREDAPGTLMHGPMDGIEEAEAFADALGGEWWSLYMQSPLPGSKFGKPADHQPLTIQRLLARGIDVGNAPQPYGASVADWIRAGGEFMELAHITAHALAAADKKPAPGTVMVTDDQLAAGVRFSHHIEQAMRDRGEAPEGDLAGFFRAIRAAWGARVADAGQSPDGLQMDTTKEPAGPSCG